MERTTFPSPHFHLHSGTNASNPVMHLNNNRLTYRTQCDQMGINYPEGFSESFCSPQTGDIALPTGPRHGLLPTIPSQTPRVALHGRFAVLPV